MKTRYLGWGAPMAEAGRPVHVGMTRSREHNRLHVVAGNLADARAQFINAMERDGAERGLTHATKAVRGIVKNGPIQRVTEELARLDREAERAEQQVARWEQTANRLDAQRATFRAENEEITALLRQAEEEAARVRAEVAVPLTVQAQADGAAYLTVIDTKVNTSVHLATVGRFGRRKTRAEHHIATEQTRIARAQLR